MISLTHLILLYPVAMATDWNSIYTEIDQQNPELQALRMAAKSEQAHLKMQYGFEDLQIAGYYLSSPSNPNAYSEWEITQNIPSPFQLTTQSKMFKESSQLMEQKIQYREQELLLQATFALLDLVSVEKKRTLFQQRVERSNRHVAYYESQLAAGNISKAELQKVQIVAIEDQFALQTLDTQSSKLLQRIALLKGSPILKSPTEYPSELSVMTFEDLWKEYLIQDAHLQVLQQAIAQAEATVKISNANQFPSFAIGANTQGTDIERYSGIYMGLSIPLYSAHHQVSASKFALQQQILIEQQALLSAEQNLKIQHQQFSDLMIQYEQLQEILSTVDYELQLEQQLLAGTLPFVEYHREYQFYAQVEEQLLDMELQLQQLLTELYKHRLLENL